MKSREKRIKEYCRSISRELYCPAAARKQILAAIRENIAAYIEENPDAGFEDVQKHFGTPQQIAASYIEELEMPELVRKLNLRRRVLSVLCISLGVCALLLLVALAVVVIGTLLGSNYYVVYVTR